MLTLPGDLLSAESINQSSGSSSDTGLFEHMDGRAVAVACDSIAMIAIFDLIPLLIFSPH